MCSSVSHIQNDFVYIQIERPLGYSVCAYVRAHMSACAYPITHLKLLFFLACARFIRYICHENEPNVNFISFDLNRRNQASASILGAEQIYICNV